MKPLFETTRNVRQVINQSLNLYLDPPRDNIQLVELENLANDRRILLGKVEALTLKLQKNSAEYESGLANAIREYDNALQARFGSDIRKYDCIAHFMVRLALSKMIDRKNWFVSLEAEILRYRLGRESVETIQKLLKSTQIKYQFLNIPNENDDKNNRKCYFKLDFELVPDLVRTRQVDLRNGFAYLTVENLRPLILQYFKSELSKRMDILSKNMVMMEEDERLMSSLKKIFYGNEAKAAKNFKCQGVDIHNIDNLSNTSFPPCMSTIHDFLKLNGHLKHRGRLQYGLFLKGIGLTLEESLAFFRSRFKNITADKFDKLYAYYIRYNYGQEGKRADFNPHSCMKVITTDQMTAADIHGCPFKQYDKNNLESMLKAKGAGSDASEIVELASNHHYQIACSRFFEIVHKQPKSSVSISHPNEYFQMSQSVYQNKKD